MEAGFLPNPAGVEMSEKIILPEESKDELPQVTNLTTSSVAAVEAELVRMHQSAAQEITAEEVGLHQSAALDVTTASLTAHEVALGLVNASDVQMTNSAAGAIRAENVSLTGHAGAVVAAQSGVAKSIPPGGQYFGSPALELGRQKRVIAAMASLPDYVKTIRSLERRVVELEARLSRNKP